MRMPAAIPTSILSHRLVTRGRSQNLVPELEPRDPIFDPFGLDRFSTRNPTSMTAPTCPATPPVSDSEEMQAVSVLFGPQGLITAGMVLQLRKDLQSTPDLEFVSAAIAELPALALVIAKECSLSHGSLAEKRLQEFAHFFRGDAPPEFLDHDLNNTVLCPLTIMLQVVEFWSLCHGQDSPAAVGSSLLDVQGVCLGFLTATAVSCSSNEEHFQTVAAKSIRLALCMGMVVDQDAHERKEIASAIAVRWKSPAQYQKLLQIIQRSPSIYISCRPNDKTATVTLPDSETADFLSQISSHSLLSMALAPRGRWHHKDHANALAMLKRICLSDSRFQLPRAEYLNSVLLSNTDGKPVLTGEMHNVALSSILTEQSRWDNMFETVKGTARKSQRGMQFLPVGEKVALPHDLLLHQPSIATGTKTHREQSEKSLLSNPHMIQDVTSRAISNEKVLAQYPEDAVAVVGMACRYPDADCVEDFWTLIKNGDCIVRPFPEERYKPSDLTRKPNGPFFGGYLRDLDAFDHRFFGISGREAKSMDPQQRICLQVAYEAVESAGYCGLRSDSFDDEVGCYIGVANDDYCDNVECHPVNAFSATGTLRTFISGRISHFFGWTGPSMVIDSACSAAAVAIHTACKALQTNDCSMALAGGACSMSSSRMTQNLAGAGFLSPTGKSKAFDESADGYCRAEGAGIVVLRRLRDALAAGDNVLGVIMSTAVNQGSNSSAIQVPDQNSQMSLYRKVLRQSGMMPEDVSYVEAHGTGTQVGDPIEFRSIRQTFGGAHRQQEVIVGSIKDNIGHTEASSGVASLIKVLLMMEKGTIPKLANFTRLNPAIDPLGPDRVAISSQSIPWEPVKRIAFINNYGAGGNNAAMIVRQPELAISSEHPRPCCAPFYISAKTEEALRVFLKNLKQRISRADESVTEWVNIAYNLSWKQSRQLEYSVSFSSSSQELTLQQIDQIQSQTIKIEKRRDRATAVVLCFGGQDGQTAHVSRSLYDKSYLFKRHLDDCNKVCCEELLLPSIFPAVFDPEPITDLVLLHIVLFSIQYACALSWLDSGLKVDKIIGHSFGQLTALCISKALSLHDALDLVSTRALLLEQHLGPRCGIMLAFEGENVEDFVGRVQGENKNVSVDIACYNGPKSFVLAGDETSIAAIEAAAEKAPPNKVRTKRLENSHAFHSRMLDAIMPEFLRAASKLDFDIPTISIEATSNEEDTWAEVSAEKVVRHTRNPVYFLDAVRRVEQSIDGPIVWLEAGSGSPVIPMIKRAINTNQAQHHHTYLTTSLRGADAESRLSEVTCQLWRQNINVQFWHFNRLQKDAYGWINLPPYAFAKTRHWLEYKPQRVRPRSPAPSRIIDTLGELVQLQSTDSSTSESTFYINTSNELYQLGTAGHEVVDQSLCPASLHTEIVLMAARILTKHNTVAVSRVQSLSMSSPLVLNPAGQVLLKLTESSSPGIARSWSFEIFSVVNNSSSDPAVHSTGSVILGGLETLATFSTYKTLQNLMFGRCHEIEASPSAVGFKGPTVYKAMRPAVTYLPYYHGIQSIFAVGHEAVGRVALPASRAAKMGTGFSDHVLNDSFAQISGVHANVFTLEDEKEMWICNVMGDITFTQPFIDAGRKELSWLVYSKYERPAAKKLNCDTFVFEPSSGELVVILTGIEFQKVSAKSLAKVLSNLNSAKQTMSRSSAPGKSPEDGAKITQVVVHPSSRAAAAPVVASPAFAQPGEHLHRTKTMIRDILEIPLEDIHSHSRLEELGIDSLLMTEIFNESNARFNISLEQSSLIAVCNVQDLADLISGTPGVDFGSTESTSSAAANVSVQPATTLPVHPASVQDLNGSDCPVQRVSIMLKDILEIPLIEIQPHSRLDSLGIDSLLATEIFAEVSSRFNVAINHADLASLTVQDLSSLVSPPNGLEVQQSQASPVEMETVTYASRKGLALEADIYYPQEQTSNTRCLPIALMIHGGGHVMSSRKDIRPAQTTMLLAAGFLPISIDYRLCPEVTLPDGPMTDVCEALAWARGTLSDLRLKRADIRPDGTRVAAVGWSAGGHLAMSLAWTAPSRGIAAPQAILAFYAAADYEDPFWSTPSYPFGQKKINPSPDLAHLRSGVKDEPIVAYAPPADLCALGGWMAREDARSRIVLHMNWEGDALRVLLGGLRKTAEGVALGPVPTRAAIQAVSPLAQVRAGRYTAPTFLVHGTRDDLVPWEESRDMHAALRERGVPTELVLVEGAVHLFDMMKSLGRDSGARKGIETGFAFLQRHV